MGQDQGGIIMLSSSRIFTFLAALGVITVAALTPAGSQAASSSEVSPPTSLNLWRPGDSGQPVRISGWVRSTTGKPIPGATIYIRQADGTGTYTPEYQGSLITGKDGSYRFSTVVLETEILFKGDPNLDPGSDSTFAIHLEEATVNDKTVLFGRFDMTLRPLGSD
jgi:hypothetical protein